MYISKVMFICHKCNFFSRDYMCVLYAHIIDIYSELMCAGGIFYGTCGTCVETRGQLYRVHLFFWFWGSSSGHQTCMINSFTC